MVKKQTHQRKKILVEKKIQFRFAKFVMFFVMSTALVTSSVVFFTTLTVLGDKLAAVYPQGRLGPIVRSAYLAFFVNLIVAFPVIWHFAIRFSHRIVGPLPKIYRYLDSLGKGIYPGRLVIRAKDELQDLAKAINGMAEDLKSRGVVKEEKEGR